ncbi:RagB/SusD family nutrient uptake outer membrane protein [Chryseobacterium sp.]|uniref:RagB/SusD family nutrient uptake outer membrane protein n=1 Tax=Chryseobacterium sp. TaxID=1871047 RepID=UPI003340E53C
MKNIIILFFLTLFISCEKLIDVDLPNNQIATKEVFDDLQTANAALAGLYAGVMASSPISGANLDAALGVYTDEMGEYSNNITPTKELYLNQQIDTNTTVYSIWIDAYKHIYTANSILTGVENSSGILASDKKYLKGEALFIRTLLFFYLNQLYGDIPYPVSTDYNVSQIIKKTSSADALDQMEEDLTQVMSLLSDDYRSSERIYPNKMAARLLLAKVYMAKHDWNNAEVLLKEIIQSPFYQIENDITKVFQKTGKHILWQLKPANNKSLRQATSYYFNNTRPNLYALNEDLVNSFLNGDLRKQQWIAMVNFNGDTWYRVQKYKNRDNTNTSEYSIVFRLEEVYLLLAETLAQQNKLTDAYPYLNSIRQRAGLPPLNSLNKEQLLNEILLENKHEFFVEMGHRFLDLKRMGRLNTLVAIKPNWKDFHQLWPIPQKEILLNANLKPQNPGY